MGITRESAKLPNGKVPACGHFCSGNHLSRTGAGISRGNHSLDMARDLGESLGESQGITPVSTGGRGGRVRRTPLAPVLGRLTRRKGKREWNYYSLSPSELSGVTSGIGIPRELNVIEPNPRITFRPHRWTDTGNQPMSTNDGVPIPRSRRRLCSYCSCTIDSNGTGVFQLANGWLENRRKGGANTIALAIRKDIYACHECIDKLRNGIPAGQMALFDPREYLDT